MNQDAVKTLADYDFLIAKGQAKQTVRKFNRISMKYWKIGTLIFVPLILVLAGGIYLVNNVFYSFQPGTGKELVTHSYEVFLEGFKIWLGALVTFIITVILVNRWQQRNVSFEMIKELNSVEFHKVRCMLVNKMELSIVKGQDIEDLGGWLPFDESLIPRRVNRDSPGKVTPEEFYEKHALSSMLYFMLRIVNYKKFDMLNIHLTRHLFHFFFCHYEVLMLEFSAALQKHIERNVKLGLCYDKRWLLTCRDISLFFEMLGLSGELAPNHRFIYFPSLNSKEGEAVEQRA